MRAKRLLIPFGSTALGDAAVCLRLAAELIQLPGCDCDSEELAFGGLDLLPVMEGYRHVIFLDIMALSAPGKPRINLLSVEQSRGLRHLGGIHFEELSTVVDAGRQMGYDVPREITVIGINIDRDFEFGERLSPGLEADFPAMLEEVRAHIFAMPR